MVLSLITAGDNSALRVLVFLLYLTWKILEMRKNLENGQNRVRISVNFDAKISI